MLRERLFIDISDFMRYLAAHEGVEGVLPPLADISGELGISVAALREQLEVARALGLVEVRPRTGMKRLSYSFTRLSDKVSVTRSLSIMTISKNIPSFAVTSNPSIGMKQSAS